MSYDPQDHTPSAKQVVAAWAVCLAIVGLALGLTVLRHDVVRNAFADLANAERTADPGLLAGVHIPEFAICQVEPDRHSSALGVRQREPMSVPVIPC